MNERQGYYAKWNIPVTKGWKRYDCTYTRYPEQSNLETVEEWWLPGAGERTLDNVKDIMLSETYQSQKDENGMISLTQGAQSSQTQKQKKNGGYQELGKGGHGELLLSVHRISVWKMKRVSEIDGEDSCTIKQLNLGPLNCTLKFF